MKTFTFYVDEANISWDRRKFEVEADSEEIANTLAIEIFSNRDKLYEISSPEAIGDIMPLTPEELTSSYATLELYNEKDEIIESNLHYCLLTPDGFTMDFDNTTYPSSKLLEKAFELWKKRFEHQGYYASNKGRIPLDELWDYCTVKKIDPKLEIMDQLYS